MHEESGHEQWVLNDLEAVGVTPQASTRGHPPCADTLALNGYNYWAADRGNPCSVLGMMYVLEVIASVYGGPFASAIKEALLLEGERGVSFIGSHATMDAEHMAELAQDPQHAATTTRRASGGRIDDRSTSITSRASSKPYERCAAMVGRLRRCWRGRTSTSGSNGVPICALLRVRTCVKPIQCYSLAAMGELQQRASPTSRPTPGSCKHFVMTSDVPGVFNFGGDLSLFVLLVRAGDIESLQHVRPALRRPGLVDGNRRHSSASTRPCWCRATRWAAGSSR